MKKAAKMLIILVILGLFSVTASADATDKYISEYEKIIPEEFSDVQSEIKNGELDAEELFTRVADIFSGKLPSAFLFLSSLLGLILIMWCASILPENIRGAVGGALSIIAALYVGGRVSGVFSEISSALDKAGRFFSLAIPVFSALTLAGGGVKGAVSQAAGMNIVLSAVGGGFGAALSLLSGFSLAMGLASSVGSEGGEAVNKYSKSIFAWVFGIATSLLMGFLSLQSFVSASADSAALRMAKYLASGTLPLVGGAVSASLSTLAAGLSYAKGVIGASAITVLLIMLLSPLALVLFYRISLSLASGFARFLGVSSAERTFVSFRSSFDILIGVYCLCGILYVFEIILFIKSGVAAL